MKDLLDKLAIATAVDFEHADLPPLNETSN